MGPVDACNSSVQACASLKVSKCLKFVEAEVCGVRDGYEVGRSVVGELTKNSSE